MHVAVLQAEKLRMLGLTTVARSEASVELQADTLAAPLYAVMMVPYMDVFLQAAENTPAVALLHTNVVVKQTLLPYAGAALLMMLLLKATAAW